MTEHEYKVSRLNVPLHAVQSVLQTPLSAPSLLSVFVCVKAAAVFTCRRRLKRSTASARLTKSDCFPSAFVSGHMEAELSHKEAPQHKGQINIVSSDSEVEIVGVQEKAR